MWAVNHSARFRSRPTPWAIRVPSRPYVKWPFGTGAAKIHHVLLAAPDIDVDLAREAFIDMGPRANRPAFTLFASQGGRALAVSRRVWGTKAHLGAINPDQEQYWTQLDQANVTMLDLTSLKAGDAVNHGKFAENPEVVSSSASASLKAKP